MELSNEKSLGYDASVYQGKSNMEKAKKAGCKFVIIRAGYGKNTIDKNFVTYINDAIKNNIAVGVYWFIYAKNTADGIANAKKLLTVLEPYKEYITMGVWADWEYDSDKYAGNKLSSSARAAIIEAFNSIISGMGYEVGIYSNQDYIKSGKFPASLVAKYPLWYAYYANTYSFYGKRGKDNTPYLWQFTSSQKGSVYGVSSANLDMDWAFIKIRTRITQETPVDKVQQAFTEPNAAPMASQNPYIEPKRVIYNKPSVQHGDDVKWVQWHLWRFGLLLTTDGKPDAKKIDGYFGQESHTALLEAQRRLGLVIDGICGKNTQTAFLKI